MSSLYRSLLLLIVFVTSATAQPYSNPILTDRPPGAPDPAVLKLGPNEYYLYATSVGRPGAFSQFSSSDLLHWQYKGYMFEPEELPDWVKEDFWAPDVQRFGDTFVAYFTARDPKGRLCIGRATSPSPTGPWKDSGGPVIRDPRVGVIDPNAFIDQDGKCYLYWKGDYNDLKPQEPTPIFVQPLSRDGLHLLGEPRALFTNTLPWEGDLVEGTCIVRRGEHYYMFYSANAYYDDRYATGVARSSSPLGPFEKKGNPILKSGDHFVGPGHGTVVAGPDGHDYFLYHAWNKGRTGEGHSRNVLMDRISWGSDGWPAIGDGTPSAGGTLGTRAGDGWFMGDTRKP